MKRMEIASVAFVLAAILGMTGITGITSAQQDGNSNASQNNNGNTNANGKNRKGNKNMNSNMSMNGNMSMDGNMSMNSNMSGGMMLNASDTDFANMAAMGGEAEIQMAQLAMQRSKDKGVMKYAKKMVKDHTKAGKELDKIAGQKSMTLTKTPNAEQMEMMSKLRQASDSEFDMMYIQMSGVQAHQTMETLFQSEANAGSDLMLKSYAAKTLPVVQMHLKMAQDMANGSMTNSMNSNMSMNSNSSMNSNMNGNMNKKSKNKNDNMNSNMNSNR